MSSTLSHATVLHHLLLVNLTPLPIGQATLASLLGSSACCSHIMLKWPGDSSHGTAQLQHNGNENSWFALVMQRPAGT